MNNFADVDMVIYHDNFPVAVCRPDHLGLMGVYFKRLFLGYPVGTRLHVGLVGHEKNDTNEECVPMVVNKSELDGTSLRLKNFKKNNIDKWNTLISSATSPLVTTKYQ